jgi:hypothetical protein
MTQAAHAAPAPSPIPPPSVPKEIAVDTKTNEVFLVGKVSAGVQIYKCTAAGWTFDRPEATLVGDNGKEIIKHFAGPTWTSTADGSSVKGTVLQRADGASGAIQWLLLSATKQKGSGTLLNPTTFIQRINTGGGVAPPKNTCDEAKEAGTEEKVPYTADYIFWKSTRGN